MQALSVRSKILVAVLASILAFSLIIYLISTQVLLESYLAIERQETVQNVRRATDAINEFSNQQLIKLSDWAAWDEAYAYVENRDEAWVEETVYDTGMANLDINLFAFSDEEGKIFFIEMVDIMERVNVATATAAAYFAEHPDLIDHDEIGEKTQGLVMLPDGPMILVSLPQVTSEGTGPIQGSITFGRYLNADKITQFSDITHLGITTYPYAFPDLPEDVNRARDALGTQERTVVIPEDQSTIAGYTVLPDLYGNPALIVKVETPRPIYAQGRVTFTLFIVIGALALLLFGIMIIFLIERFVVSRFVALTKGVERINTVRDLSIRVSGGAQDEVGRLADRINRMLTWLSEARTAEAAANQKVVNLLEEVKEGKEKAEDLVALRTEQLREEQARLLASINSLSFGFVIADRENHILLQNPALVKILDLSEVPDSVDDLKRALEKTDPPFDPIALCNESLKRWAPVERAEVSYGKKFLRFLCAPILPEGGPKTPGGGVIGHVLLVEDVTEAKVIDRSREEFFTIASHELRTPLTAIQGNAGMLLSSYEDKLPKDVHEMLKDINVSSKRLIEIVNDFLEVSRLEQGKIEWKHEDFDLAEVVESAVRNLCALAEERTLTLTVVPPAAPLPHVRADKVRVEQVLDNLIGNALKFTEKGTITVQLEGSDGFVRVRVSDTGAGISEHNQTLLFRKFQQAGENIFARDVSQSTGLGLYISKLIIEAMGGTIALERSELGKGSVFTFTLPAA